MWQFTRGSCWNHHQKSGLNRDLETNKMDVVDVVSLSDDVLHDTQSQDSRNLQNNEKCPGQSQKQPKHIVHSYVFFVWNQFHTSLASTKKPRFTLEFRVPTTPNSWCFTDIPVVAICVGGCIPPFVNKSSKISWKVMFNHPKKNTLLLFFGGAIFFQKCPHQTYITTSAAQESQVPGTMTTFLAPKSIPTKPMAETSLTSCRPFAPGPAAAPLPSVPKPPRRTLPWE